MAHAQIELYPERQMTDEERVDPVACAAYFVETKWGWRKVIYVEPPEAIEDSGTVFVDREAAFSDASERFPNWPIG